MKKLSRTKIRKEWIWAYVFIAPMFIGTLIFGLFPIRVFICSFSDRLESAVRIWRICRAEEFCYCFYIKDDSCGNTEYSGLCGSICADYTASFRVFCQPSQQET